MMLRPLVAFIVFACGAVALPVAAAAQSSTADLLVRIDQLANQLRQLTGEIEQMQYRNQQLEAAVRRLQEESDTRPREGGGRGQARAPAAASRLPVEAPAAPAPLPTALVCTGSRAAGGVIRRPPFGCLRSGGASGCPRDAPPVGFDVFSPAAANCGRQERVGPWRRRHANDHGAGAVVEYRSRTRRRAQPQPVGALASATAPPSATPRDTFDLGYGYMHAQGLMRWRRRRSAIS